MQIDKSTIMDLLRERGQQDQATQAEQELPDQVDTDRDAGLLQRFGVVATVAIAALGAKFAIDVARILCRTPEELAGLLAEAGIDRSELLIAASSSDEANIIAQLRTGNIHHALLEDNKNYLLVKDDKRLRAQRAADADLPGALLDPEAGQADDAEPEDRQRLSGHGDQR